MFLSKRSSCSHRVMQAESSEGLLQRRAEVRRRKLLLNSEQRMKKIVGFSQSEPDSAARVLEPRFHLDLERNEPWSSSGSSNRLSPLVSDPSESSGEEDVSGAVQQRLAGSPRRGLQKYVSRFDDAMKLRGQLSAEKTAQDGGGEELDSFCVFRLVCSVALAVFVRIFVCQYLVSAAQTQAWDSAPELSLTPSLVFLQSVFAPFLTLELGFMGLHKYFPKVCLCFDSDKVSETEKHFPQIPDDGEYRATQYLSSMFSHGELIVSCICVTV
uniref:Calcium signal-modulating cyclophilin ligand-like n=1 Tax=Sinocyclocheilus grahami TaxID=75366 RepID=A0A672PTR2_SINGR